MGSRGWTVTLRHGPGVERIQRETLPAALAAMEARIDELAPLARRDAIRVAGRRYEPIGQVALRAELTGPGRPLRRPRGGIDVRGDGSMEAYTGHVRRVVLDCDPSESVYGVLGQALAARGRRAPRGARSARAG
jgi:hypothetical protein